MCSKLMSLFVSPVTQIMKKCAHKCIRVTKANGLSLSLKNFLGSYDFEVKYKAENTVLGKNKTANSEVLIL